MDIVFKIILTLHILGGTVGLIAGTTNLVRKKGDKKHKLMGKIFAYGMYIAGFASLDFLRKSILFKIIDSTN